MATTAREFFEGIPGRLDPAKIAGESLSYRFDIADAGSWKVDVRDGAATVAETDEPADCVIRMKEETLQKLIAGEAKPQTAFLTGKIKIDGDMALALKLKELFF